MGRRQPIEEPVDSTGWILDYQLSQMVLLQTVHLKFMFMLGYTYLHGCKLWPKLGGSSTSMSYKFVSMILQCTGGGILVPVFLNGVPVPLAQDAYPMAIIVSFLLHQYFPILREVLTLSPILKTAVVVMYETLRASVVVKLTAASAKAIPPSEFDIAVFGPIFCGTIAGCGGAFLPLHKGLDPIKTAGLGQPMISALIGASFYHLMVHTSLGEEIPKADKKAHVLVALFFILYHLYTIMDDLLPSKEEDTRETKKTK